MNGNVLKLLNAPGEKRKNGNWPCREKRSGVNARNAKRTREKNESDSNRRSAIGLRREEVREGCEGLLLRVGRAG